MFDERGWRGSGEMPSKQAIESVLEGATANVSSEAIVVELAGVPQSKLVYLGVPADIAMLITEGGRRIDVFAPQITMSHGLAVGMTLEHAKQKRPELTCSQYQSDTTCSLPGSHFAFRIYEAPGFAARIDHVIWVRDN